MITEATKQLVAAVRDPSSSEPEMQAAAQSVLNLVTKSSASEANAAITELAGYISLDDPLRGAFVALVCGAMVEDGCDPTPLTEQLIPLLKSLLESSVRLAEVCVARLPKLENEDDDEDATEVFDTIREQVSPEMPLESTAWESLNRLWPPAIAVFSVSPSARVGARGLRDLATKIVEYHDAGHWLSRMLSVLDNEPTLVIEPQTRLGMLARMSGVVENFQLNVLLMDTFPNPGIFARRRVPKSVADVARGIGPQQTDETVKGCWNLYNWTAIEPGLKLPDSSNYRDSDSWIWGEGSPEDISVFEGRRVVLLGPASYARAWGCARMFDKLPATLEVEQNLAKDEVTDWLQRMLTAKTA